MTVVYKDIFGNELSDEDSLLYSIEDVRIAFGHNVQRKLNDLKLSRQWLAQKLDLTEEQLSDLVFGDDANPDLLTIATIAYHLKMKNILE